MPLSKESNPRLLLSKLREGDYAHAGAEEAIELVLDYLEKIYPKNALFQSKKK